MPARPDTSCIVTRHYLWQCRRGSRQSHDYAVVFWAMKCHTNSMSLNRRWLASDIRQLVSFIWRSTGVKLAWLWPRAAMFVSLDDYAIGYWCRGEISSIFTSAEAPATAHHQREINSFDGSIAQYRDADAADNVISLSYFRSTPIGSVAWNTWITYGVKSMTTSKRSFG